MVATKVRQSNCPGLSYMNVPISAILTLEGRVIHHLQRDILLTEKRKKDHAGQQNPQLPWLPIYSEIVERM